MNYDSAVVPDLAAKGGVCVCTGVGIFLSLEVFYSWTGVRSLGFVTDLT